MNNDIKRQDLTKNKIYSTNDEDMYISVDIASDGNYKLGIHVKDFNNEKVSKSKSILCSSFVIEINQYQKLINSEYYPSIIKSFGPLSDDAYKILESLIGQYNDNRKEVRVVFNEKGNPIRLELRDRDKIDVICETLARIINNIIYSKYSNIESEKKSDLINQIIDIVYCDFEDRLDPKKACELISNMRIFKNELKKKSIGELQNMLNLYNSHISNKSNKR